MKKLCLLATAILISSCAIISPDRGNQNNVDLAKAKLDYTECLKQQTLSIMYEIEQRGAVMDYATERCEPKAKIADYYSEKVLADIRSSIENDDRNPYGYTMFLQREAVNLRNEGRVSVGRFLSKYRDIDYGLTSPKEFARRRARANGYY